MTEASSEPDDELELDDADESSPEREELYAKVVARCDAAGLKYSYEQYEGEDEEPDLVIDMPAGRDSIRLPLYTVDAVQNLLDIEFEKFRLIEPYEGVIRYDAGFAEVGVGVTGVRAGPPPSRIFERLSQGSELVDGRIVLSPDGEHGPTISLGPPSDEFSALIRFGRSRHLTVRFENGLPHGHDEVVSMAERYSNALFFQLDIQANAALSLNRRLRRRIGAIRLRRRADITLEYPRYEYDTAPMSLYWYARGAAGLPLLQFLAYYQVVEYFFPLYSRAEAQRRIRSILKDPSFRVDRESDIGRIVSCIRESRASGFFDERTQLRATINEVTNADEIRSMLSRQELREFYEKDYKKVVATKLPIGNVSADLRNEVAERLYNIRCKIVHTKSDGGEGEVELLLPESPEEQHLGADIELMAFVARACLIASGSPIH